LQTIAGDIEKEVVPAVKEAMVKWLRMVVALDAIALALFFLLLTLLDDYVYSWALFSYDFTNANFTSWLKLIGAVAGFGFVHFSIRAFSAKQIASKIVTTVAGNKSMAGKDREAITLAGNIRKAFLKNTQPLRSILRPVPAGWSMRTKRTLLQISSDACEFIQGMNDRYTKPSGEKLASETLTTCDLNVSETVSPINADNK
jgi:hypothetical protein